MERIGFAALCSSMASLVLLVLSCRTTPPPAPIPPVPAGVDLRPDFERFGLTPKDQAPRGCCSLFAICGLLEFEWARVASESPPLRLSEEYLNWASHQTNGRRTDGSFFSDALRGIATFGVCRQELVPYAAEFDPELEPPAAAHADAAGRRDVRAVWIKEWDVTTGMTPEMLASMRRELSAGHPVAIGMRWPHEDGWTPEGWMVVPPPERVFDGHSIILVGWQDDARAAGGGYFLFRNSYGASWREKGYGRMPYAYAAAYGNDALSIRLGGGELLPCNRGAVAPLECETLSLEAAQGCDRVAQDMTAWGAARWSAGAQFFCDAAPGEVLTIALPETAPGMYRLSLFATRAPDYGMVHITLQGNGVDAEVDLYGPEVAPTGRLPLGTVTLTTEAARLQVRVAGRNPASAGTRVGLDCVELTPVP